MKRIEPRKQYDEDGGYPSVVDVDLSRRGFFGAAVVGAVGLGLGGAVLLPDAAEAGRPHGARRVVLPLIYLPSGCKFRVEKIMAQSTDRRLIAFLGQAKERPGLYAVLRKVLKKVKCSDLHNLKRLEILRRALGVAIVARYRKRTRRRAKVSVVSIVVGRLHPHGPVDGEIAMPSVPLVPVG